MSYLRAFAPWIVFALVPSSAWQWAAAFALALSVLGIVSRARAGLPLDAQIIEIGTAAYFAALTALAFAEPHAGLHTYTAALASGALGLIGLVSLAARRPFTLGVAKQSTPREYWDNPVFLRTNRILTSVWTASFVLGCAALAALAHSSVGLRSTVQVAAFALPLLFTLRYVAHVQARAKAAGAQLTPADSAL